MFDKIIGNKSMQKLFLNQFKKICKEEGIKSLFISVDEAGNGQVEKFTDEMICIKKETFDKMKQWIYNKTKINEGSGNDNTTDTGSATSE